MGRNPLQNSNMHHVICDNISYASTARALFGASLALLLAACGTFGGKNEAPVCDGKQRRPANAHGSILPGAPSPAFVAPAADTSPGKPPEILTVQPPAADTPAPSLRGRDKGRGTSPRASLGASLFTPALVFASC